MRPLGDRQANTVSPRDVEVMMGSIARTGVDPRTVNLHRQLVRAIYGFATKPSTFALPDNPAQHADKRREPGREPLDYYSTEEVEQLAQALTDGRHRDPDAPAVSDDEHYWRSVEDRQDGEIVRVAAFTGLRRGELVVLRWRDVNTGGRKITVRRTVSDGQVSDSTKSRRAREVGISAQAASALAGLVARGDFTSPGGVDIASVQAAMGHSSLTTTNRYLHARPAHEVADRFTAAFNAADPRTPHLSSGTRDVSGRSGRGRGGCRRRSGRLASPGGCRGAPPERGGRRWRSG